MQKSVPKKRDAVAHNLAELIISARAIITSSKFIEEIKNTLPQQSVFVFLIIAVRL